MGKNRTINGVNWSSLRKFAAYTFKGVKMHNVIDEKYYFIYIDKKIFNDNPEEVDDFENTFYVEIKPFN